jgi:ZIP family zinc transporter/zinc and cadmium transporter
MTAIAYALLAAGANVAGALAVVWPERRSLRVLDALIAVAAGFMVSVALIELIPEALRRGGAGAPVTILAGYLLVHFTQHTLTQHFHFGEETHAVSTTVSVTALAGLLLHTFVDGVAIASGFGVSDALGTLVFAAIGLHKLPEGLAIASLFLAAGWGRRVAVGAAAALGLATVAGVVATHAAAPLARHGLALAAGVTLYVGASNLVPEFQARRGWRLAAYFFGGCAFYYLTSFLLR